MKKPKNCSSYFFVDESGDPTFYDAKGNFIVNEGSSPLLILGLIETQKPHSLRQAILDLQQQVISDGYLQKIPSISKTAVAFHAKNDSPEIRYLFYKLIKQLDFKAQFIVARKIEKVFRNDFKANENEFYDHLVTRLFRDVLHRYRHNHIYFSERGSRKRQEPLLRAILKAKQSFENNHQTGINSVINVQAQNPKGEPCLSIIDYLSWAVYRAYTKREMRYYEFINDKVSLLVDLYDREAYPKNCYYRKNAFDISKATPL